MPIQLVEVRGAAQGSYGRGAGLAVDGLEVALARFNVDRLREALPIDGELRVDPGFVAVRILTVPFSL